MHLPFCRALIYLITEIIGRPTHRNPNYHTLDDTPDTLDYNRMAMVVKAIYAAVLACGE